MEFLAKSVGPDLTAPKEQSDLGLHRLLRHAVQIFRVTLVKNLLHDYPDKK